MIIIILINCFRNRQTKKNAYIFIVFIYTHTETRKHQKAVLPRHVVPLEAENLASPFISIIWFGKHEEEKTQ